MTSAGEPTPSSASEAASEAFEAMPLFYRNVCPTDLAQIYNLERQSYPADEAASRSKLQYRQHHAAAFFRCAVRIGNEARGTATTPEKHYSYRNDPVQNSLNGIGDIVGFVTATRCHAFTEESMEVHHPSGPLLAIHSVVVDPAYRNLGYGGQMMKNYIDVLLKMKLNHGIRKVVLMAKANKLTFYLRAGFQVVGKSDIQHGQDTWYHCEMELPSDPSKDRKCPFWVIDSFAKFSPPTSGTGMGFGGRGSGNPAAVVMVTKNQVLASNTTKQQPGEETVFDPTLTENVNWMKLVAKEFNLSETAFIWKYARPLLPSEGDDEERFTKHYNIRFYTCDGTEVDLCGHATLAASSAVFQLIAAEGGKRGNMSVRFYTNRSVVIKAHPARTGNAIRVGNAAIKIVMDFPIKGLVPISVGSYDHGSIVRMILNAFFPSLGVEEVECDVIRYCGVDEGGDDLLVEITNEAFMKLPTDKADIDFKPIVQWEGYTRGLIVCCQADEGEFNQHETVNFMSRFFGPKVGIEEDPVTGSAHCVLGPYFAKKMEKRMVVGYQKSQRGGIVECHIRDEKIMSLVGTTISAMNGNLYV